MKHRYVNRLGLHARQGDRPTSPAATPREQLRKGRVDLPAFMLNLPGDQTMKTNRFLLLFLFWAGCCAGQEPALPGLSISLPSPQMTRLAWPATAADWSLTTTASLASGPWVPVSAVALNQGNELAVLLPVTESRRFYRLEQGCVFKATPPAIQPGGSSVLTWCERPGVTYQLFPAPGPVSGGTLTVSPTATTTYFLLATQGEQITSSQVTVTVGNGGNTCPWAELSGWSGTLDFSYELTPSHGDWSFMIRQEAHLSFQLTRTAVVAGTAEFTGTVTGNAQLNDRAEELDDPNIRTVIGNGAPQTSPMDDRVSRFYMIVNCTTNTCSLLITPTINATGTSESGTVTGLWSVGKVDIRNLPLPQTVGPLSGSKFLPARGPTWTGTTDNYHPGGLGDVMFITNTVNDESAGSASVNWALTPVP
jgi:hypothetical protein